VKIVDFKEALIMAFLGLLRIQRKVTALASVTGAKFDTIGGAVWSN
jgi:anhydro-N-acetylmuramic acid kinase